HRRDRGRAPIRRIQHVRNRFEGRRAGLSAVVYAGEVDRRENHVLVCARYWLWCPDIHARASDESVPWNWFPVFPISNSLEKVRYYSQCDGAIKRGNRKQVEDRHTYAEETKDRQDRVDRLETRIAKPRNPGHNRYSNNRLRNYPSPGDD